MSLELRTKIKAKIDALQARGIAASVQVVRQQTSFDPATQSAVVTEQAQKAVAVVAETAVRAPDGTIQSIERSFKVPALSLKTEPRPGDILRLNKIDYTITSVQTSAPGGVALIYTIRVAD